MARMVPVGASALRFCDQTPLTWKHLATIYREVPIERLKGEGTTKAKITLDCQIVATVLAKVLNCDPSSTVGPEKRSESDIRIYEKQGDMRRGIGKKLKT